MKLRRGDIVLVPFPFTDLSANKVRPAVIVSAEPQNTDLTIAFISSVVPEHCPPDEFILAIDNVAFADTGLKVASVFKMRKLITLSQSKIIRYLGHAPKSLQKQIDGCLKSALGLI